MRVLANDPIWERPIIFDPNIGERRYFWSELSPEQKFAELEFQKRGNRRILKTLLRKRGSNNGNI